MAVDVNESTSPKYVACRGSSSGRGRGRGCRGSGRGRGSHASMWPAGAAAAAATQASCKASCMHVDCLRPWIIGLSTSLRSSRVASSRTAPPRAHASPGPCRPSRRPRPRHLVQGCATPAATWMGGGGRGAQHRGQNLLSMQWISAKLANWHAWAGHACHDYL